jgi:Acyl-CoA dehydrogenase, C-terminal domain
MGSDGAGTALPDYARAFRPRILAERERIEAGRRIPDDLAKDLARAGFFRISQPAVYGGATSLYTSSPLERAFRDVHAIPQHISVHPSVVERTGRVLFGLEPEGTMPL